MLIALAWRIPGSCVHTYRIYWPGDLHFAEKDTFAQAGDAFAGSADPLLLLPLQRPFAGAVRTDQEDWADRADRRLF